MTTFEVYGICGKTTECKLTWTKFTCSGDIKNKMDGWKWKSHKVHTFCQYNLRYYIDPTGSGSGQWGEFLHRLSTQDSGALES